MSREADHLPPASASERRRRADHLPSSRLAVQTSGLRAAVPADEEHKALSGVLSGRLEKTRRLHGINRPDIKCTKTY